MKYAFLSLTLFILATACTTKPAKLLWETDAVLTTCESVIYDYDHNVLYVSNINGTPDVKDGNGFISKVSLDGKVTAEKWVTGMDAPKGLGIFGNTLYVTDIDRVHEIDVNTGKIIRTDTVKGAKFLNDITTDMGGNVYISDSNTGNIYVLTDGVVDTWKSGIAGPNGLLSYGPQMMMVSWGDKTFNTIDMGTKEVTLKSSDIENPDGIEPMGDGSFLVSSWNGVVRLVGADGKAQIILDTRADSLGAADIEYIASKRMLLVPTFFKNKVMAYELKK